MNGAQRTDRSDRSDKSAAANDRLRPGGGFRRLRSFQVATLIYDATFDFCERFLEVRSRTKEQMVQAARSGRQNIAEGSRASAASSQTELRLVSVARASLDELLLDYEDFLRQRKLPAWSKDCPEAREVREIGRRREQDRTDQTDRTDRTDRTDQSDRSAEVEQAAVYARWLGSGSPAVVANTLICLIHQANYLLDRQIAAIERQFIEGGGYSERLASERIAERQRRMQLSQTPKVAAPNCPLCSKPMSLRTARKGRNAGSQFWGCSAYPQCKGTRELDAHDPTDQSDPTDPPDPPDPAGPG